jgi:uncharacterized membrane protein (DUF485 family)
MKKDDVLLKIIRDRLDAGIPHGISPRLSIRDDKILVSIKVRDNLSLQSYFNYPISEIDAEYIATQIISYTEREMSASIEPLRKSQVAVKADTDIQALRTELETLKATLARQPKTTANSEEVAQFQASLMAMEARVASLTETIPELTVPIYIPPREEMAPRLISSQAFTRLEEARSDEQWAIAVLFLTLGSIIGMLINYATVESATGFEITRAGQIAIGLFVFAFAASIVWLFRIHKRVNEAKGKVLASSTEVLKRGGGTIGVDKLDKGG